MRMKTLVSGVRMPFAGVLAFSILRFEITRQTETIDRKRRKSLETVWILAK